MQFSYQAKKQTGELQEGKIDAPSEEQAVNILHQKNLIVLTLVASDRGLALKDISSFLDRPSKKDVVLFTRQLATLVDADVPLVEGLHALTKQVDKPSFKAVINGIVSSIEGGATLSVAVAEYPKVFTKFYVSLVKAGEVAGKLQTTLSYLADYLERSASLNSKIRGALSYPAFVLAALLVVAIVMMTSVLPQLLSIVKDAGVQDIPLVTRILIASTDFVNRYIILLMGLFFGMCFGLFYYIRTPDGAMKFDRFKINLPQLGQVVRGFYIARIAETLATLIKSGVPILESLTITSNVAGNAVYRNILAKAQESVRGGGTISEVFELYNKEFPSLVSSMLAIGEKTGRTDFMLENIFNFYKTESENSIQNLSQLLEPILILILGIGVGVLVAAVLLPIYSLVSAG